MKKEIGFFRWMFSKWYYWLISIVWSLFAGYEELRNGYVSEFLGILTATFLLIAIFFGIAYFIKKTIATMVDKEIKKRMKKN